MGQDQASGGVSVLCWPAAPVAMFYGNLQNSVIRSKSVFKSSSVINSQKGVMSDQLRVSLYMAYHLSTKFHENPSAWRSWLEIENMNIQKDRKTAL